MIEVELLDEDESSSERHRARSASAGELPSLDEVRRLCVLTADSAGVREGHVAVEFVGARRIAELNAEYRGKASPTDVLSFPVDGAEPAGATRELGDVVICPEHTTDVREAIVHGVLHLLGMDHETDGGEMLALQGELLARAGC
jgi:probable rRNA maturation factor